MECWVVFMEGMYEGVWCWILEWNLIRGMLSEMILLWCVKDDDGDVGF